MPLKRRAILLALHPRFARLIYSGEKTAELRRVAPSSEVRIAYIYETAPVGRVTGWFQIEGSDRDSATKLWSRYQKSLSITRAEYLKYVRGCRQPTVLSISSRRKFRRGLALANLHGPVRPPQSYRYFDPRLPIHRRPSRQSKE